MDRWIKITAGGFYNSLAPNANLPKIKCTFALAAKKDEDLPQIGRPSCAYQLNVADRR